MLRQSFLFFRGTSKLRHNCWLFRQRQSNFIDRLDEHYLGVSYSPSFKALPMRLSVCLRVCLRVCLKVTALLGFFVCALCSRIQCLKNGCKKGDTPLQNTKLWEANTGVDFKLEFGITQTHTHTHTHTHTRTQAHTHTHTQRLERRHFKKCQRGVRKAREYWKLN